jgi:hypothetical protein
VERQRPIFPSSEDARGEIARARFYPRWRSLNSQPNGDNGDGDKE